MEPPDVGTVSWYPQMSRYPQIFQPLVSPLENREKFRIRYPQIFGGVPALPIISSRFIFFFTKRSDYAQIWSGASFYGTKGDLGTDFSNFNFLVRSGGPKVKF